MKKVAVIYSRFSPRPDADECESIETQLDRCRAYCAMNDFGITSECEDRETSGATSFADRAGGKKLLSLLNNGTKHVVVYKLDRMFRDAADCLTQVRRWDQTGVALHLIDMGGQTLNTSSAMGRFFLTMVAGFAELERNLICERTKDAMLRHQANGRRMSKLPPYGWRLNPENPLLLIRDETEQAVIGRIVELFEKRYGVRAIARMMDADGVPCRGRTWYHQLIVRILKREGVERRG